MRKLMLFGALFFFCGSLLAQGGQPEPFSFKNDQLGMSFEKFKANHQSQGHWETNGSWGTRNPKARPFKNSKWVPDIEHDCKGSVTTITECKYSDTITDEPARGTAIFVDGKLAALNLSYQDAQHVFAGERTWQALRDKFGAPQSSRLRPNREIELGIRRILVWDNGVSVVSFNNTDRCIETAYPFGDIAEILEHRICESENTSTNNISVWYIHKALASLISLRRKQAADIANKKAKSDL